MTGAPGNGGPVKVLICDDHQILAEGLAGLLRGRQDMDVVGIVGTSAAVIEQAAAKRPDVVLMDYELPDGDGVAATAAVKAAVPDTKVVMLTSYSDEAVLVGAIEAGCSGFLTKHKSAQEVVTAVRLAADGEALISPDMLARLLPRLRKASPADQPGADLTEREREVLSLLADGLSSEAMGARLYVSPNTIRNHVQNILVKLGAHSRLEAVAIAARTGILPTRA
ncbi:MAG TPA: response regulator transcription factor [Acidimicrobiales bacterium]|nr:response regulator transcription factor [Acidimicrobiales bacterium]